MCVVRVSVTTVGVSGEGECVCVMRERVIVCGKGNCDYCGYMLRVSVSAEGSK